MTTTTVPTVAERVPEAEIAYVADDCLAVNPDSGDVIERWTDPLDYDASAVWATPPDAARRLLVKLMERGWRPPGEPAAPREVLTEPARLVDLLADVAEAHGYTVDRRESTRPALLLVARLLHQVLILPTEGGVR